MSTDDRVPDHPSHEPASTGFTPAPAGSAPPLEAPDVRIGIDEFLKVDMRVARVIAAERVPKSKKLLKLDVDLGAERRILVAGLADAYEPEALIGRVVAIVVNLKPATLMGVESNGMILAATQPGGQPIIVGFDKEPPLGARLK